MVAALIAFIAAPIAFAIFPKASIATPTTKPTGPSAFVTEDNAPPNAPSPFAATLAILPFPNMAELSISAPPFDILSPKFSISAIFCCLSISFCVNLPKPVLDKPLSAIILRASALFALSPL